MPTSPNGKRKGTGGRSDRRKVHIKRDECKQPMPPVKNFNGFIGQRGNKALDIPYVEGVVNWDADHGYVKKSATDIYKLLHR